MIYQLFIDTTNKYCYVALYNNDAMVNDIKLEVNKNVTDVIVPSIDDLLKKNKINKKQISQIYLDIGPGSFTGVRVGIIIVKAWAFVYDIQIYYIDSLTLQMPQLSGISLIDAKSQKYYLSIYKNNELIQQPIIISASQIDEYKNKFSELKIFIDCTSTMYDNFLIHKNQFIQLKKEQKLQPLYIKPPL